MKTGMEGKNKVCAGGDGRCWEPRQADEVEGVSRKAEMTATILVWKIRKAHRIRKDECRQ